MAVYTVHEPPPRRYESAVDPERFTFVRDGFSLWACVFGPLWMLRHRMWLVLLGYLIVAVALEAALRALGVSAGASLVVGILFALLIGFEAPTLRRFTLARRKWRNVGIIVGDDLETAERRFFDAWTKAEPGRSPAPSVIAPPAALRPPQPLGTPDVIGLFPDPGGRR
jgi:Protein of unknown function (DUF2628)